MQSSQHNSNTGVTSAQATRRHGIVGELLIKAGHVILGSRTPGLRPPQTAGSKPPAKSWFNLEVPEVEAVARELEPWRRQCATPLVIEVYLKAWGSAQGGNDAAAGGPQYSGETLLERWTLQFVPRSQSVAGAAAARATPASRPDTPAVYKRMVIALRSLYSYVRILPAFRLQRACKRDIRGSFSIRCRIAPAAAPDIRTGSTGRLRSYDFAVIETPDGVFHMGVKYQPATAVKVLEQTALPVPPPQIIADYLDGPTVASRSSDCRQRAQTMPQSTLSASLCLGPDADDGTGGDGSKPLSQSPPTSASGARLLRRHSWSMQGRANSGRFHSPSADALPPHTPPSPRFSPRQPQSTSPSLRTLSTPPRYPLALSSPRAPPGSSGGSSGSQLPPIPQLRPRGTSRLSPVDSGFATSQATSPATASPRYLAPYILQEPAVQTETQAGSLGSRRISAPVRIPQRSGPSMHSSVDLHSMGDLHSSSHRPAVPASAPAGRTCHSGGSGRQTSAADDKGKTPFAMQHPLAQPPGAEVGSSAPATPATPPIPHSMRHFGSEASSYSSSYPIAGSPQLPFAVTPSAHSLAGSLLSEQQPHPWSHAGLASPSPPMSGRNLTSAMSGAQRQQSWGAASATAPPAAAAADSGMHPAVGYSVSPVNNSLGSSIMSTPRGYGLAGGSSRTTNASAAVDSGSLTAQEQANDLLAVPQPAAGFHGTPPLPLFPPAAADQAALLTDEESADLLPFALDEASPVVTAAGGGLLAGAADDSDALGAFVRMIDHAPPLHAQAAGCGGGAASLRHSTVGFGSRSSCHVLPRMSLAAGLAQLRAATEALPAAVAT